PPGARAPRAAPRSGRGWPGVRGGDSGPPPAPPGDDGAYAFADLDSGEYTVIATGYPPVAGALTVAGRGIDGHDIELAHPGA
ncbi:hypothetical protein, partial [Streptomyces sp. NPDC059134]|uniref:hypothetical protein n=1 Tax=Streptomyces sp. NPDC059134 TaxID=3346738 RepID=UPI00368C9C4D